MSPDKEPDEPESAHAKYLFERNRAFKRSMDESKSGFGDRILPELSGKHEMKIPNDRRPGDTTANSSDATRNGLDQDQEPERKRVTFADKSHRERSLALMKHLQENEQHFDLTQQERQECALLFVKGRETPIQAYRQGVSPSAVFMMLLLAILVGVVAGRCGSRRST